MSPLVAIRLLHVSTFELRAFYDGETIPHYAILSHRWYDDEVTFDDLPGYVEALQGSSAAPNLVKIRGACARARDYGMKWIWIDSCCINKSTDAEEKRSIKRMFGWYQMASVCLAYLSDVDVSLQRQQGLLARFSRCTQPGMTSEWLERGWTLQELLAPMEARVKFFDRQWEFMGTREGLAYQLEAITGISECYLDGSKEFFQASIAQRISWQSRRKTKIPEDMVYSLFGILGVTIEPNYDEGESKAFQRLQEELINRKLDESLFAWTLPESGPSRDSVQTQEEQTWGLLAPGIDCFRDAGDIVVNDAARDGRPGGIGKIAGGIRVPMPTGNLFEYELRHKTRDCSIYLLSMLCLVGCVYAFHQVKRHNQQKEFTFTLNCSRNTDDGQARYIIIVITRSSEDDDDVWRRCKCDELGEGTLSPKELKKSIADCRSGWKTITIEQPDDRYQD